MKAYNAQHPLLSIHIPKAGGASFANVLKQWFGNKLHWNYYDEYKGKMPKKVRLKQPLIGKYRSNICIHGHFNRDRKFGLDDYYPNATQLISILREPVELQVSFFFFKRRLLANGAFFQNGKRIDNFFDDVDEFLETVQSHMLLHFPNNINTENYKDVVEEKFVHLGVMENYQMSIDRLADKLSKKTVKVDHLNKSYRYQQPSQSSIKKFRENHLLEYKIYEYANMLNS